MQLQLEHTKLGTIKLFGSSVRQPDHCLVEVVDKLPDVLVMRLQTQTGPGVPVDPVALEVPFVDHGDKFVLTQLVDGLRSDHILSPVSICVQKEGKASLVGDVDVGQQPDECQFEIEI